jgi:hypothetical protein
MVALTLPVMLATPAAAVKLKKLATPGWSTSPVPVPVVVAAPDVMLVSGVVVAWLTPLIAGT